jgi:uncharacterized repeat protein (TIGR01451 family)
MLFGDQNNNLATSSVGLPAGMFTENLATSTNFAGSNVYSHTWNATNFTPNQKTILNQNDSDCVTVSDLPFGTYYYSPIPPINPFWNATKYSDQETQPVNSVFDLFAYSTSTGANPNADGVVDLNSNLTSRTIVLYTTYNPSAPSPECSVPQFTSSATASAMVGTAFSYTLTASSTESTTFSVATSTLPDGLSFATTTSAISGTPTTAGTFNISLSATNACGIASQTLVLTVASSACTSNCGGGGGGSTADLSVTKTVDKSTANVGDTLTYTIGIINNGPDNATGVNVKDILPSGLTFISATSTVGSYATTTGIWTIGGLMDNASTTLTLVATVDSGTEGQTITNTAVGASDQANSIPAGATSSVSTTINNPNPVCVSNCGGTTGNGGGGGGGGNGPIVGSLGNGPVVAPTSSPVVSTTTSSVVVSTQSAPAACYYLYDYLRKDFNNNPVEVKKLQIFLNSFEGDNLTVNGIYDDATVAAVNAFQVKYAGDILIPWGYDGTTGTGYTYILTKKKVNEIFCQMAFPVNAQQQAEIDATRAFFEELQNEGININNGTTTAPILNNAVGLATSSGNNSNFSTLAGVSTTTKNIASRMTANIIGSGRFVGDLALALVGWPAGLNFFNIKWCGGGPNWFVWLLVLIIIIISFLWYREYSNNRKIENLNKEIDLEK